MDAADRAGYLGIAALMALENVFPPIPSEAILPLAGAQVALGVFTYASVLTAATAGSLAGALVLYTAGRAGGRPLVLRHGRILRITPAQLDRAEHWFDRHGAWVVLLGRLVPGVRSLVSVPAGMARMPVGRFLVLTAIGSLLWNGLLVGAGSALGANWEQIGHVVAPVSLMVLAALGLAGVALVVRALARARP
jgi:membrane protein DedA with SNARE-associated domain